MGYMASTNGWPGGVRRNQETIVNTNRALREEADFTETDALGRESGEAVIESFRQFYGPTMNAFEAAEKNGKVVELHRQLVELAKAQNQSSNGGTSIPATFLRVTVCP